jgi:hypothetical protein
MNVSIKSGLAVQGAGNLTVNYNNAGQGGQLLLFPGAKIDFWDISSGLKINGNGYLLVDDLATLGNAVASNPLGFFAFAKDYDAGPDGAYKGGITDALFQGTLEGLGHTISNFSINGRHGTGVGMIESAGGVNGPATVRDLTLNNVAIQTTGGADAGAFVGEGSVDMFNVSSSGTIITGGHSQTGGLVGMASANSSLMKSTSSVTIVTGANSKAGGLVGSADGPIVDCLAAGNVSAGRRSSAGGLAGFAQMQVDQSFATGNVQADSASRVGGLAGQVAGYTQITNSYATGTVQGGHGASAGGLVGGDMGAQIALSYSVGHVDSGKGRIGGFIGDFEDGTNVNDYWDIDTSGQSAPCKTACGGVTGMSDGELKSGLPFGFNSTIWGQNPAINNGYPYLIANPPQ